MGSRWVGVLEETAYASKPAGYPTGAKYLPFVDGEPVPNNNQMDLRESIYLMDTGAVMGGFVGEYTLRTFARPDNIANLLKWIWGTANSVAHDGMQQHTFTMSEGVKSFFMEHVTGASVNALALLGCVVKTVEFEAAQDRPVMSTWTLQYNKEDIAAAPSALGTIPSVRPFTLFDATVTSFGQVLKCESFRVRIERTVPDDAHTTGSRFLPDIVEEGFEITGELEGRFADWTQRQKFYGLAGASTTPQDEYYTGAISIACDGPPSGQVHDSYDLEFSFPAAGITEIPSPVNTRDRLRQTVNFKAFYSASNQMVLTNMTAGPI